MTLIEDTRNQVGKHAEKRKYFEEQGVKVVRSKLYVGDYSRLDKQTVCIDTKKDVLELAQNVCGSQHERFRNECIRASEAGIDLVILVEESVNLAEWQSPRRKNGQPLTKVKGETLLKAINTMRHKYGVSFLFCKREESGRIILEILKGV